MEGLTQPFLPAQPVVGIQLGCRLGGDHPVHNNILELHWSKAILPCKFMDFNLQAYQADHLLHLSAKPARRSALRDTIEHTRYVLGDNRVASLDSRIFGPVKREYVVGKVWLRGWPLESWKIFGETQYSL